MEGITIIGLGPGNPVHVTREAFKVLRSADNIFVRTIKHPSIKMLLRGKRFQSFDYIYENADTFEEVYEGIANSLINELNVSPLVYAVPGHPCVGEKVTNILLERLPKEKIKIVPGLSFLDVVLPLIGYDPVNGLFVFDALEIESINDPPQVPALIMHIYSREIAGQVKLHLLETIPPEQEVILIYSAGIKNKERVEFLPLHKIDHAANIDHLVTLFIPKETSASGTKTIPKANIAPGAKTMESSWQQLIKIMDILREDGGCPWDREQTWKTLEPYLIEEAYEVKKTLEEEAWDKLPLELGDLLLQIVFLSRLGKEEGQFTIEDVVSSITQKLMRRHPHVFGDKKKSTSIDTGVKLKDVVSHWEEIKLKEGKSESITDGIPDSLPALHQAELLQSRAAGVGFDWPEDAGAIEKLREELGELEKEIYCKSLFIEEELGDFLFALVNVSRRLNINSERALRKAIVKFKKRFKYIEETARRCNRTLSSYTLSEMDKLWDEAKEMEKKNGRV